MRTSEEISREIRAQLKLLDPELSAEPLTPERKIIDTVAEVIAEAEVDKYVLNYQFDIDTKSGSDLDRFIALFGFARQGGTKSTGSVTFYRNTPAPRNIQIPVGTQVMRPATSVTPAVVFQTTAPAILYAGTKEIEVPIEAVESGAIGNVPSNTITRLGPSTVLEISEVFNQNSTTGGSDAETDAELRIRFKNTIFRNISGTEDQYLALAISSQYSKKANVIGPQSRFIEYLQVEPDLSINSQITYSKYTYPFDYYLTSGEGASEVFYTPDVHFTFNNTVPPSIEVEDSNILPVGSVVLLEHTYCSKNSRNDPENNVLNAIDIYVSGSNEVEAVEAVKFPGASSNFVNNASSKFHIEKFVRYETGVPPTVGNRFQQLLWQPVTSLPSRITINNVTYYKNTHYWLVADTTNYRGSKRARCGIEWLANINASEGDVFVLTYVFDRLPLAINELIDSNKPVASDVLVHSANERFFNINFIVMYSSGYIPSIVNTALTTEIQRFFEKMQFGAVIQISDLIEVGHSVPGIDNIRLATPSDGVSYGIQEVARDGITPIGYPQTKDFLLEDSDLPILNSVITHQRSQNTWISM